MQLLLFSPCLCVHVCVYHHGKTSSLESTTVVGVTTEEVLRTLWSVIRCLSVSVCCGQICDFDSVTDVQDTVMDLYMCVREIKVDDRFVDGCGSEYSYNNVVLTSE